jgi:hypothetical protein
VWISKAETLQPRPRFGGGEVTGGTPGCACTSWVPHGRLDSGASRVHPRDRVACFRVSRSVRGAANSLRGIRRPDPAAGLLREAPPHAQGVEVLGRADAFPSGGRPPGRVTGFVRGIRRLGHGVQRSFPGAEVPEPWARGLGLWLLPSGSADLAGRCRRLRRRPSEPSRGGVRKPVSRARRPGPKGADVGSLPDPRAWRHLMVPCRAAA